MTNLISYKEGASFIDFGDWQDKIEQGEGESYGVEFFLQKKKLWRIELELEYRLDLSLVLGGLV